MLISAVSLSVRVTKVSEKLTVPAFLQRQAYILAETVVTL
jgi:3-deoxy-D-manno-octulosonic acid (KDO) 8-phosphate synthase